jgi:hypothetical protein
MCLQVVVVTIQSHNSINNQNETNNSEIDFFKGSGMETLKIRVVPTFRAPRKKCKFHQLCELYSNTSYTCTHVGGKYCGKYRALNQTPKNDDISFEGIIVQ